jgi:site-specific DNA-methyltransferase (adenine-specific)
MTIRDARKAAWEECYRQSSRTPGSRLPANIAIKHCDFRKLRVEDGSVDLILTDPPWGVDFQFLYEPMATAFARWLKPGGLLLAYVGNASMPGFLDAFRSSGLTYQWLVATANRPSEEDDLVPWGSLKLGGKFSAALRPLLLFSKGKTFRLHKTPSDVLLTRVRYERTHPLNWQQSLDEARYFVSHFAAPTALIVDPFLGSGTNAVAVALEGQGRRFVGSDIDKTCLTISRRRVSEAMTATTRLPERPTVVPRPARTPGR